MGPIFAHVMTPAPLTEVLTQGPTDSADQQVFVGGYIGANKSLRVKFAWIGFALSFVLRPPAASRRVLRCRLRSVHDAGHRHPRYHGHHVVSIVRGGP